MNEKIMELVGWIWGYTDDKKIQEKCSEIKYLLKQEGRKR